MKRQPREPKPFYKASHKAWYVQKDGKQHRLGPVMDDDAKRLYHEILAAKPEEKPADFVETGDDPIVAALIDDFLFSVQLACYRFPDPCVMKVESALVARRPVDEYETSSSAFGGADCS